MNNHNYYFKILRKINNSINSLLKRNLNKLNYIFKKEGLLNFLSFKRTFVFFLVLLTFIFSYLSTPYFYNSEKLVTNIKNQLLKNLNLDFNLSANYSYNFFPKPYFIFKNSSIQSQIENLGEIKIYISLNNLLFPSRIKIQDITLSKTNFYLDKKNYDFFFKLLNNDFSFFKLKIKNSNIFYKNIENDVLFINKINELKYFYDTKDLENILLADNEIFNISHKIKIKHDNIKKKIISRINLDFINLQIQNDLKYENLEKREGLLKIIYNKKKSEGTYNYKKDFFEFNFFDKSIDQNFKYNGFVNLKPFFSEISGNLNKINLDILLNSNSILIHFLKTGLLNSNNLNIVTKINSKKTSSFKDLVNLALKIKISEGMIDINDTKFSFKNYADIKLTNSLLYTNNNNLILDALVSVDINNVNDVYKIFQTPRNKRKEIKKVEFNLNYNFDQRIVNFNGVKVDDLENEKINKNLNQIILKDNKLQNKIYIKNLVNQVIKNYAG